MVDDATNHALSRTLVQILTKNKNSPFNSYEWFRLNKFHFTKNVHSSSNIYKQSDCCSFGVCNQGQPNEANTILN